jgi:hypothetical protein
MQILTLLSFLMMFVASLIVSSRLLLLARATRGLPEFALGLSLFALTGIGYPSMIAGERMSSVPMIVVGMVALNAGMLLLALFVQRVFRPTDLWAKGLLGCLALSALVQVIVSTRSTMALIGSEELGVPLQAHLEFRMLTVLIGIVYLWAAIESLSYRRALLRRIALGLGDPIVANRLALWGIMALVSGSAALFNTIATWQNPDAMQSTSALLVNTLGGSADAVLLLLAFVPPKAYLEWVGAPAQTEEA